MTKKNKGSAPINSKAFLRAPRAGFPPRAPRMLVRWFERQRRILPWREEPTPYRVWVSEIMLQQTQVITVVPYFDRFMTLFPSVEVLAAAAEDQVIEAWAGLGYYSRARNLHRAAKRIVAEGFPRTREGWIDLPGVGAYTAGAICSIALDQPEALVDGNVERVLARLFRLRRGKSETRYREALWARARESIAIAREKRLSYSALNQGWMELGALICTPKNPRCGVCPLKGDCAAFARSEQDRFPEKKAPKEWIAVEEKRVALFSRDGARVAMIQARPGEWRAGLWDFPTTLPSSLAGASKTLSLGKVESRHVVTRHRITRRTEVRMLRAHSAAWPDVKWVAADSPGLPLGAAPKQVLQLIRERYEETLG